VNAFLDQRARTRADPDNTDLHEDFQRAVRQARQMRADARLMAQSARVTSDRAKEMVRYANETMRRLLARRQTI